jgi:hypothetical protein
MKDKNYPIKYALLPVQEEVFDNGRDYYQTACFIVSKAFVEEEYKQLKKDGTTTTSYKICFPHTVKDKRINYLRKSPDSSLARDNEFVVSKLYDTYVDAKKEFDLINLYVPLDKLNVYEDIELEILELTRDLVVEKEEKTKIRRKENEKY